MHSNRSSIAEQQFIKINFVLPEENDPAKWSLDMIMAYETASDHIDMEICAQVSQPECLELKTKDLDEKLVFVFGEFSGKAFEHIKATNAILIGPRCLISCFIDNVEIPLWPYPMFTTAMRNAIVCTSGLTTAAREEIKELVQKMGGLIKNDLNSNCTHLVSNTVKSNKYERAASISMKIMHPDWVNDVWQKCQTENILGTDPIFDKHKLPMFYALTFCSTGITPSKKDEITRLIEKNGGKYIGSFKSIIVDILILERSEIKSAKYQAAVRFKKECLTPEWIIDSVREGHALPIGAYEVKGMRVSTPTKLDRVVSVSDFNPDCSQLSEISHIGGITNCTINDSMMSSASGVSVRSTRSKAKVMSPIPAYRVILEKINLQQAKKAGPFLDGCNIYLSGFSAEDKDTLYKILNRGGATRFDELSEIISHVLVGEQHNSDFKLIETQKLCPYIVTIEWLVKSIELKSPAPEENFKFIHTSSAKDVPTKESEPPSPASKKNLKAMNSTFKRPELPKLNLDAPKPIPEAAEITNTTPTAAATKTDDANLLMQYMQKNKSAQLPEQEPKTTDLVTITQESEASQIPEFLVNKTFFIYGFADIDSTDMVECFEKAGGQIVGENYRDTVDYAILPTVYDVPLIYSVKAKQTVNDLWFEHVFKENECDIPMEYYFHPIYYQQDAPKFLKSEIIVFSAYDDEEKHFLRQLAEAAGAEVQDIYPKRAQPLLICNEPIGSKYEAAIKWKLAAVNKQWLVDSIKARRRLDESKYLVGKAECSSRNIVQNDESSIAVAQENYMPTASTDDLEIDDDVFVAPRPVAPSPVAPPPVAAESRCRTSISEDLKSQLENPDWVHNVDLLALTSEEKSFVCKKFLADQDKLEASRKKTEEEAGDRIEENANFSFKHRRLSEINGHNTSKSPATPTTPISAAPDIDFTLTTFVKDFATPVRETLYEVLKKREEQEKNMTPSTKLRRELLATPKAGSTGSPKTPQLPAFMREPITPYGFRPDASPENHLYHKRKLQVWDQHYDPVPKRERRVSTPLSVIKERFYLEACGQEYYDKVQSQYDTQYKPNETAKGEIEHDVSEIPCSSSSGKCETKVEEVEAGPSKPNKMLAEVANAENLKKLSDLIAKNKQDGKNSSFSAESEQTANTELQRFDSEQMMNSEDVAVGWNDPTEFHIARRFKNKAYVQPKPVPKFSFSTVSDEVRMELSEKVLKLKGTMVENSRLYDPTCTHVITSKPNRGEKILCAIAAGKWILSPKYVEDSFEAGNFLNEEQYEWGNPQASNIEELNSSSDKQTSVVSYQWRNRILNEEGKSRGAFTGFRVLLVHGKKDQFIRVLNAGGGVVIDCEPPFKNSDEAMTATHCFVDDKKIKLDPKDHKALAEAGIAVLSIMYLNVYLTSMAPADQTKYLLPLR